MKITTQIVERFNGGQLEIQNSNEHYLYRGEVERAWVEGGDLHVKFKWLAKMGSDGKWHTDQKLDYKVSLEITSASEVSEDRLFYSVMFVGERGTFFPPNGTKLDPSTVIGLQPAL